MMSNARGVSNLLNSYVVLFRFFQVQAVAQPMWETILLLFKLIRFIARENCPIRSISLPKCAWRGR